MVSHSQLGARAKVEDPTDGIRRPIGTTPKNLKSQDVRLGANADRLLGGFERKLYPGDPRGGSPNGGTRTHREGNLLRNFGPACLPISPKEVDGL